MVVDVDGGEEVTPGLSVTVLASAVLGGSSVGLCGGSKIEEAHEAIGGVRGDIFKISVVFARG